MPYRTALAPYEEKGPGLLTRLWNRWIGRLVYGGPETCGHCKFWRSPKKLRDWYWDDTARYRRKVWYDVKGDCKLLFGTEDKTQHENCDRFRPRRRYMHREKTR